MVDSTGSNGTSSKTMATNCKTVVSDESSFSRALPESCTIPRHVAVIMDGNGRWAQERQKPRIEGHKEGVHSVRRVLEESRRVGISYVTLYAFSSENWERPESEVNALMGLFAEYLVKERETFLKQDIRLRAIGDRERLPVAVRERLEESEEQTAHCKSMTLVLAVSYGGRDELVRAAKNFATAVQVGECEIDSLTPKSFSQYLDTASIPDPDLLIRTSGEFRVSNFLLWQLAYTEIVVTNTLWPDFSRNEFYDCIEEFSRRERRFGKSEVTQGESLSYSTG